MNTVDRIKEHIGFIAVARTETKARVKVLAARIKQGRQEQRVEHARSFAHRPSSMNGSTV